MLLIFVSAVFIIVGLCWKIRIFVKWESVGTAILAEIRLRVFYGVFTLRLARGFNLREGLPRIARNEIRVLRRGASKKKSGWKSDYLNSFHLQKIDINVRLGIGGDAYYTALSAGLIRILFLCAEDVFPKDFHGYVEPDYLDSIFRIKLEGIIDFYPKQIITAAIKRLVTKIRGKKYAASH